MSQGINYLHSHSGIEVELKFPKHEVLVDEEFEKMFRNPKPFMYRGKMYAKVSTREFAEKGGIFKNLAE